MNCSWILLLKQQEIFVFIDQRNWSWKEVKHTYYINSPGCSKVLFLYKCWFPEKCVKKLTQIDVPYKMTTIYKQLYYTYPANYVDTYTFISVACNRHCRGIITNLFYSADCFAAKGTLSINSSLKCKVVVKLLSSWGI